METIYDNPKKLHAELLAADLPVVGVSSNGRVDYSRALTKTEIAAASALIQAHDPAISTEEARQAAYKEKGITAEAIAWAVWDQIINSDSSKADALITAIQAVDATIH